MAQSESSKDKLREEQQASPWNHYVGNFQENTETVNRKDLTNLACLLDYPIVHSPAEMLLPWPQKSVPPFAHWLNSNMHCQQSLLGEDGHPQKGDFIPEMPFPRRMWAGSRIQLFGDYQVEQALLHRRTITAVQNKSGRSGEFVLLTLTHDFFADDKLVLKEEQDIIYRSAVTMPTPAPRVEPSADIINSYDYDWCRTIHPDPMLLFRYSAVTSNSHRIHYDRDYAINVERYPGLVFHGPLTATLLVDLYQRNVTTTRISKFQFKGIRPLYDMSAFFIMGKQTKDGADLWAVGSDGDVAMEMQLIAKPLLKGDKV